MGEDQVQGQIGHRTTHSLSRGTYKYFFMVDGRRRCERLPALLFLTPPPTAPYFFMPSQSRSRWKWLSSLRNEEAFSNPRGKHFLRPNLLVPRFLRAQAFERVGVVSSRATFSLFARKQMNAGKCMYFWPLSGVFRTTRDEIRGFTFVRVAPAFWGEGSIRNWCGVLFWVVT